MIYLNKLLPLFFSPLVLGFSLIILGAWLRRRAIVIAAVAVLWAASTPVISDGYFRWIEGHAVRRDAASLPAADAIVVLSGMQMRVAGRSGAVPEWGEAIDRLFGGVEALRAGKADRIIFTAGRLPWQGDITAEGELLRQQAIEWGVDAAKIRLTSPVANTAQEALAVRDLLAAQRRGAVVAERLGPSIAPPHVILVTSAFHMSRARALFEEAGLRVTPYPVDFRTSALGRSPTDYFPDPEALRRSDIAIRELIGRAYYRARALLR